MSLCVRYNPTTLLKIRIGHGTYICCHHGWRWWDAALARFTETNAQTIAAFARQGNLISKYGWSAGETLPARTDSGALQPPMLPQRRCHGEPARSSNFQQEWMAPVFASHAPARQRSPPESVLAGRVSPADQPYFEIRFPCQAKAAIVWAFVSVKRARAAS